MLATGLGAIGLYGVMAFAVARRTREIGLRMALGADRRAVLRMVLRGAAGMAAGGIGLGAVLALALGRYVESQLYGIRRRATSSPSPARRAFSPPWCWPRAGCRPAARAASTRWWRFDTSE